uniref:Membrane cofactor protein n=1 Tax=Molossus molossus TaxID=27622 RepID=A0A7J8CPU3_MOLMO|nr:hypothetical protein HJG59_002464 [Molossus molossus]
MTVSYELLRVPSRRLESPLSWCIFGILLGALELLLPISSGKWKPNHIEIPHQLQSGWLCSKCQQITCWRGCGEDACGAPPRFNSMKVKGNPATSYNTGDKVEYECRIGFRIIVPPLPTSTVCQADNTWTPPLQEACTAKSCPQLPEPINGHKIYANGTFVFGSQVHFFCDEGYYLLGTKILYCELDGKNVAWNDNPPRCEKVLCQPPKQIPNGMYTNSHKDVFEYNEVVTYSCNPSNGSDQYSLVGESRLVCSGPNKWSGDPPECKVIKCAYPVIKNGKLVSGIAKKFYYKSLITVGCLAGFHLKGSNTAVCGLNGTWEPKLPECIADVPTTVRTTPSTSRQPAITTTVKSSKPAITTTVKSSKPAITTTVKSSNQPEVSFPSDDSPTKEDGLDGKLFAVIVLIYLALQ